jgi:hypothetical protein
VGGVILGKDLTDNANLATVIDWKVAAAGFIYDPATRDEWTIDQNANLTQNPTQKGGL